MRAIGVSVIIISLFVGAAIAAPSAVDIRDAWKSDSLVLAKAMHPGAGFSFRYDGKMVGPEFSADWRVTTEATNAAVAKTTMTHQSGLTVTRETRPLASFGAIEYRLRFKNTASKTLPAVSAIQALDISFDDSVGDDICFISSGGGLADGFLPPRNFAIRKNCSPPTVPYGGSLQLTTEGGRSSNKDLPFLFVHNDEKKEGMFIAFGWSGQWEAYASSRPTTPFRVWGKIPNLQIALEPGEEIEGPTILIGFYKGDAAAGSNQLRRLIRDAYTPKLAGARMLPIVTYDHWWNIEDDFDETLLRKLADGAAAIGQEYFLLDAGWFAGPSKEDGGWFAGVGNWEEINHSKLPNGLKPVADYVRSKGLKFGLWFEPERVAEGSQLAKEHPDWILWEHGEDVGFMKTMKEILPDHPFFKKRFGLLDYGRPEVQQWVRTMLDRYIRDYGVKYIRYDFNMDPLPYWDVYDKPNRRGMAQLKHVQGFYAIIDWLRARHPDTVLEGCASGGRRIDLETARRFHTFWISDYTIDPSVLRFHLFGINYFLPGNYHYIAYTLPLPSQKDFQADDLGFQSLFGGAFGTGGRVDLWPEEMKRKALLHVETYKKLRRYLIEDYYPLSAQPADVESWSGWQFQDPKDQTGFVQTFRTKTPDAAHRFLIHKLEERARYRFTDVYSKEVFELTGSKAMTEGIEVKQAPMSSRIFMYQKVSN